MSASARLQPEVNTRERPSKPAHPTSDEVLAHVRKLEKAHPKLVSVRELGKTFEKRLLYAVTVTDPTVDDKLKQNVLVVGGQHGNEESARIVALATLDWLVSDDAAETRKKQKIVVIPNANPDGADHDLHLNAQKYRINMDQRLDEEPVTPEAKAIRTVGDELCPDVYVDLHARGGAGVSHNMVMYPWTRTENEDDNIVHEVAFAMVKAAEDAGLPHITHSLTWWTEVDHDSGASTLYFYKRHKSLVILTENAEHNDHSYDRELVETSGVARFKALVEFGNQRHPKLYYEGYPNYILGLFDVALVAVGETPAQRRDSRVTMWREFKQFKRPRTKIPEPMKRKEISFAYTGEAHDVGYGVYLRSGPKMKVKSVTLDGDALEVSETDGYYSWQDKASTMVVVAMPKMEPGEHKIVVEFE
jgi:hypothetical protein